MKRDATVYRGTRDEESGAVTVTVDGQELSPERSLKVRNHSPDGFEWGYGGSGPSQLALALLLDFTDDDELASFRYMQFKFLHVAGFDFEEWQMDGREIRHWLEAEQATDPFTPINFEHFERANALAYPEAQP